MIVKQAHSASNLIKMEDILKNNFKSCISLDISLFKFIAETKSVIIWEDFDHISESYVR